MKKVFILLVLAAMAFSFGNVHAQKVKLNVIGGYSMPMGELKGVYPDDIGTDPEKYFTKAGFNVGGVGKYYFDKKNSIGVTLSVVYNKFNNSVDNPDLATKNIKFSVSNVEAGLGLEYRLPLKGWFIPFVGAEFTANFITGSTDITNIYDAVDSWGMKGATRFGMNGGIGFEMLAMPNVSFVVGAKYQMFNLIGKDTIMTNLGAKEYGLNDKAYGIHSARNLGAIQIYAGVNYNIDNLFRK
ncbi:MAG: PorT family protein [Bacteroidetes bacterium]|nr:PorT family protein [Bacteroidota bacterium]